MKATDCGRNVNSLLLFWLEFGIIVPYHYDPTGNFSSRVCGKIMIYQSTCVSYEWYIVYHHLRHMTLWSPCVLYYNKHTWKMLWRFDFLKINIRIHTHRLLQSDYHAYKYASTTHVLHVSLHMIITKQSIYYLLPHKPAKHVFPTLEYTASYVHMLHQCKASKSVCSTCTIIHLHV